MSTDISQIMYIPLSYTLGILRDQASFRNVVLLVVKTMALAGLGNYPEYGPDGADLSILGICAGASGIYKCIQDKVMYSFYYY